MDTLEIEKRFVELNRDINAEFDDLLSQLDMELGDSNDTPIGNSEQSLPNDITDDTDLSNVEITLSDDDTNQNTPTATLTPKQIKQLQAALDKQKDFLQEELNKTKLSKKDKKQLEAIEHSDASIETVKLGSGDASSYTREVLVIRKINDKNIGVCEMYTQYYNLPDTVTTNGFRLGTMLGKKLQVRNDDIKTTYNRQRRGSIDRRMLAELGVGNVKIFEKTYVQTSNDAGIHISIDASGSMGGRRFHNAITTAIAIAKAADMVGEIRVRIDVRSVCNSTISGRAYLPTVVVAYDSNVNTLQHIKKYFKYLSCGGSTPEGICFQAIKDIIKQGGRTTDKYFINMSDGEPDQGAEAPTTRAIKEFKSSGLKVLSYFISSAGYVGERTKQKFDAMYGKECTEYIDTNNIMHIAKTMNKLLSDRT